MSELKLRDYQEMSVQFLRNVKRAGLFADCGLGKTAIVLSAIKGDNLPVLVVAPKRVAENVWDTERGLWAPHLSLALSVGSPESRERAARLGADITVVSWDNLNDPWLAEVGWKTVVIDELSGYKNHTSRRFKTMKKLTADSEFVWGLTGTPQPNGLQDLWAQVSLIDRGVSLGRNITTYRNRWFTKGRVLNNGVVLSWDPNEGAKEEIHEAISGFCLSLGTEGRVDLPDLVYNFVEFDLPAPVRKVYKEFAKELVVSLGLLGIEATHTAASAGVLTSKLSQITSGFLYRNAEDDGETSELHNLKVKAVRGVVDETGSPVMVMYRFKHELERLKKEFPNAVDVREPGAIEDWNAGKIPVMTAHPGSAGHGLNLQHGGHTQVWLSLPWSLEFWHQTVKRLHRSGQKHPVVVHIIQAKDTIDRLIWLSLEGKDGEQADLLSHLESVV